MKEAKKEQRKRGCSEEGGGSKTKREKEASVEQEEGARPGRGIYIFFMILFNLTRSLLSPFPSQVLLSGGCAQKADRVKLLPSLPPLSPSANLGDLRDPYTEYENPTCHSYSVSQTASIK